MISSSRLKKEKKVLPHPSSTILACNALGIIPCYAKDLQEC